jgi:3-oxoacyl-[acyl-carrier protein] reductase
MGDVFKDKVVPVTGSGQGIGRATALAFAEEGAKVVTNNRKPGGTRLVQMTDEAFAALPPEKKKEFDDLYAGITGDAETTAQTIIDRGGESLPIYADISKPEDADAMIEKIANAYGTIHIVVNVAGLFGGGPLTDISEKQWDQVYGVKPKGYFNVMKAAIPHMVKQHWGRILNATSKAMMGDIIKMSDYCAANAAAVGLTQAAACEYFHEGITVNAFDPFARTRAMFERGFNREQDDSIPGFTKFGAGIKMPLLPEMVPPFLLYLCTDDCKEITGTAFCVGGNEISIRQYPTISKAIKRQGEGHWTMDELEVQIPRFMKATMNILDVQ